MQTVTHSFSTNFDKHIIGSGNKAECIAYMFISYITSNKLSNVAVPEMSILCLSHYCILQALNMFGFPGHSGRGILFQDESHFKSHPCLL